MGFLRGPVVIVTGVVCLLLRSVLEEIVEAGAEEGGGTDHPVALLAGAVVVVREGGEAVGVGVSTRGDC